MRRTREALTKQVTDLLDLQTKEKAASTSVPGGYTASEELTELIGVIKDILADQMVNETTMENRWLEVHQEARIHEGKWKNVAGLLSGMESMSQDISIWLLCIMIDATIEIRDSGGKPYRYMEEGENYHVDYVVWLGDEKTTLTRTRDEQTIAWTNGQRHLPYKIGQAMEENEVWQLTRHAGGVIMDSDMMTAQQRIIDFKKKIKERVQREYVEGSFTLAKTGDFMGESDDIKPNPWKRKDEAQ